MNSEIIPFLSEDQAAFKSLVLDSLKEFDFDYDPKYDSDLDDPSVYSRDGGVLYVLKLNGKIIGSIAVINRGQTAELKRWYVSEDQQGKGFGTMLLDKAIKFCIDKRFKKIEFETNKKFTKAHKLYKKKGFRVFKEDEESLYMRKELTT